MSDGGRLVWRVGAKGEPGTTKCGNKLPPHAEGDGIDWDAIPLEPERQVGARLGRQLTAINVTTYAWVYVLP